MASAPEQDRDWRLLPIVRLAAAALSVLIGANVIFAIIATVRELLACQWRETVWHMGWVLLSLIAAATFGRLFVIAAWTGEEPVVQFDDNDDANAT